MVKIELTRGYATVVDDCDADLSDFNWCALVDHKRHVYAVRTVRGSAGRKTVYLHRVILARKLGHAVLKGAETDHKDGDGLNNRRSNLRLATPGQNQANSRDRQRASRFRGVYRNSTGWMVKIGREQQYIGWFRTEEAAAKAYNEAARRRYGPFARLNEV